MIALQVPREVADRSDRSYVKARSMRSMPVAGSLEWQDSTIFRDRCEPELLTSGGHHRALPRRSQIGAMLRLWKSHRPLAHTAHAAAESIRSRYVKLIAMLVHTGSS